MLKFFRYLKRIVFLLIISLLIFLVIHYLPIIKYLINGNAPLNIHDTELSSYIQDMGTLLSLKQSKTGTVENKTMALFGITANSIEIDYNFEAFYGVNLEKSLVKTEHSDVVIDPLSKNQVDYKNKKISIYLPEAELISHSLKRVGEARKQDFLKPISEENVNKILQSLDWQLVELYSKNSENLDKAWVNAEDQLKSLMKKFLEEASLQDYSFEFKPLKENTAIN